MEEVEAADSIDAIHAIVVGFGAKRAPSAQTFRLVGSVLSDPLVDSMLQNGNLIF